MLTDAVRRCLLRDLEGLEAQLDGYPTDDQVWAEQPGFANSTGTLVLHCCGNLRHFVGHVLGGTDYRRDRAAEFATRGVPRDALRALLAVTRDEVVRGLAAVDPDTLEARYPADVGGGRLPTDRLLVHLVSHLGYHLGQADGHRRATTRERVSVGAMDVSKVWDPS